MMQMQSINSKLLYFVFIGAKYLHKHILIWKKIKKNCGAYRCRTVWSGSVW